MKSYIEIAITVVLVLVFGVLGAVFGKTKEGKKIQSFVDGAIKELPVLDSILAIAETMLPGRGKYFIEIIRKGITGAELYRDTQNLTADQRKAEAMSNIQFFLKIDGVALTDKETAIVSDIVDIMARTILPHKEVATPAETPTDAAAVTA